MLEAGHPAKTWLAETLGETPARIDQIRGGGNNRAFRVQDSKGRAFLLKIYFHDTSDLRDRLKSEYDFMTFAWESGMRCVPEPIASNPSQHLGLYRFIEGRRPTQKDLGYPTLNQALNFIITLNLGRNTPSALNLSPASEACFSLFQHIERIEERIRTLEKDVGNKKAGLFIQQELRPAWDAARSSLCHRYRPDDLQRRLSAPELCLSPSDFGYHNTLIANDRLFFFDFEYAGWDDPAKLAGDFFSQVALPVSPTFIPYFINRLSEAFPDPTTTSKRMLALLPAYRIKWCCILLNEFLPDGKTRRSFALRHDAARNQASQLDKAIMHLESLDALMID